MYRPRISGGARSAAIAADVGTKTNSPMVNTAMATAKMGIVET